MARDGGGAEGRGDEAFRQTFDRVLPLATRAALRLTGDRELSEDLAAEALTRLYVSWWRLASHQYQDAWVLRVTTNLAIDALRKRRHTPPASFQGTTSIADEVVLRLALADALHRLSSRQRQVVVLRYLSDLSEADVATALGVSVGSVKTHLHRALAAMRSSFQVQHDEDVEVRLAIQP